MSDNCCTENPNIHFAFNYMSFENRAVYVIKWNILYKRQTKDDVTWRKRIASCITKATETHSEHVILTAFPLQQMLHERASMFHYMCIDFLVNITLHLSLGFPKGLLIPSVAPTKTRTSRPYNPP